MDSDLAARLDRVERRNKLMIALVVVLLVCVAFVGNRQSLVAQAQSLRVSEIVVVDRNGVERVRIGGNLPDPVIGGRSVPRGARPSSSSPWSADGPPV